MPLDEKGLGTVVGVLVASTGLTALRLVGHSIAGAIKRPGLACGALIKKNRPRPNSQRKGTGHGPTRAGARRQGNPAIYKS